MRKVRDKEEKKEKISLPSHRLEIQLLFFLIGARRSLLRRNKMDKYRCTVCGYIYDPAAGDPSQGIQPGTSFASLPDSWVCPECGVTKDMFEKV